MPDSEFCFSFISEISVSFQLVRFVLLMFSTRGEVWNANKRLTALSYLHFWSWIYFVVRIRSLWFLSGRSKNVWESPKGCLLFSFTLQMEDGRVMPQIQYVVSLAVTEAIKDVCDRNVGASLLFIHGLFWGTLTNSSAKCFTAERWQHTQYPISNRY